MFKPVFDYGLENNGCITMISDEREKSDVDHVLATWFGLPGSESFGTNRMEWWMPNEAFDHLIKTKLLALYERAASGKIDHWAYDVRAGLALIILLDQVPRNVFRGSSKAFETDAKALGFSERYLSLGFDRMLSPVERLFAYLPYEHSENMRDQLISVHLTTLLGDAGPMVYAWRHREVIDRFGRFPHRNTALERKTPHAEESFLNQPNSSF